MIAPSCDNPYSTFPFPAAPGGTPYALNSLPPGNPNPDSDKDWHSVVFSLKQPWQLSVTVVGVGLEQPGYAVDPCRGGSDAGTNFCLGTPFAAEYTMGTMLAPGGIPDGNWIQQQRVSFESPIFNVTTVDKGSGWTLIDAVQATSMVYDANGMLLAPINPSTWDGLTPWAIVFQATPPGKGQPYVPYSPPFGWPATADAGIYAMPTGCGLAAVTAPLPRWAGSGADPAGMLIGPPVFVTGHFGPYPWQGVPVPDFHHALRVSVTVDSLFAVGPAAGKAGNYLSVSRTQQTATVSFDSGIINTVNLTSFGWKSDGQYNLGGITGVADSGDNFFMCTDEARGHTYALGYVSKRLVKLQAANLSQVITYVEIPFQARIMVCNFDGPVPYLYIPAGQVGPNSNLDIHLFVARVNGNTMAPGPSSPGLTKLEVPVATGGVYEGLISPNDGYLWFPTYAWSAVNTSIVRLSLATFEFESVLDLYGPGANRLISCAFHPGTGLGYFGTDNAPGAIVVIDLVGQPRYTGAPMTLYSQHTFPSLSSVIVSLVDPQSGYGYFASSNIPLLTESALTISAPTTVVMVRLVDMLLVRSLVLAPGSSFTTDGALVYGLPGSSRPATALLLLHRSDNVGAAGNSRVSFITLCDDAMYTGPHLCTQATSTPLPSTSSTPAPTRAPGASFTSTPSVSARACPATVEKVCPIVDIAAPAAAGVVVGLVAGAASMFSWFTLTKQKRYVKSTSRKGRLGQMAMDGSKGLEQVDGLSPTAAAEVAAAAAVAAAETGRGSMSLSGERATVNPVVRMQSARGWGGGERLEVRWRGVDLGAAGVSS